MNKDWFFAEPIPVNNQNTILAQCQNCQEFLELPDLPNCTTCQLAMDLCEHGVACEKCSYLLILEWIKVGNLQKGDLPTEQLTKIRVVLKAKFNQEVYEEGNYLRVKEVND